MVATIAGAAAIIGIPTASCPRRPLGPLHRHSFTTQLFAIQFIDGVISISIIFKFHKAIAILDENFTQLAIAAEKTLNVSLLHSVWEATNVDTSSHVVLNLIGQQLKMLQVTASSYRSQ